MTVIGPLLKDVPTTPVFVAAHVTTSGAGLIVIEQPVPTTPLESVTWTLNVPAAVGVPVTAPLLAFRLRPAGSVPTIAYV